MSFRFDSIQYVHIRVRGGVPERHVSIPMHMDGSGLSLGVQVVCAFGGTDMQTGASVFRHVW